MKDAYLEQSWATGSIPQTFAPYSPQVYASPLYKSGVQLCTLIGRFAEQYASALSAVTVMPFNHTASQTALWIIEHSSTASPPRAADCSSAWQGQHRSDILSGHPPHPGVLHPKARDLIPDARRLSKWLGHRRPRGRTGGQPAPAPWLTLDLKREELCSGQSYWLLAVCPRGLAS